MSCVLSDIFDGKGKGMVMDLEAVLSQNRHDGKILVFVDGTCRWCRAVFEILFKLNLRLNVVDVSGDSTVREQLRLQTGRPTVPLVFYGGTFIGGHDDVVKLVSTAATAALEAAVVQLTETSSSTEMHSVTDTEDDSDISSDETP